jgi:predicted CoA-binding protein
MADEDQQLREILLDSKTISVVRIKDDESKDAFQVPKHLQENGGDFVPVNPKVDSILGESSFARLSDVDLVNPFRAPENIPGHVSEALAMGKPSKAVWMQLGIYHGQAASELRAAGMTVIQDRYIMVDPRHLSGATKAAN